MRLAALALLLAALAATRPAAASSADELVRLARAHELAHEDDVAVRRYMEALALDPTCRDAYLGLGDLRVRRGDLREAERVYSVALAHLPQDRAARVGRAEVRRALGATELARADLLAGAEEDVAALRRLAGWYGEDGHAPAQLAIWRRIAVVAAARGDLPLAREARTMVRALLVLVGPADPAAGASEGAFRGTVAALARRGLV